MFRLVLIAGVILLATQTTGASERLWDKEGPLSENARTITITTPVPAGNPQPVGMWTNGAAVNMCTRTLLAGLWGPPQHLTVSLKKTDVWDRRGYYEEPLPLSDIKKRIADGAKDIPEHYNSWYAYDFPCTKPVGQIIVSCPDLEGAEQPTAVTHCIDGTSTLQLSRNNAKVHLTYLPMMTRNLIAIRGAAAGLTAPISIRLYRHKDINGRTTSTLGTIDSLGADQAVDEAVPGPYKGYDYSKDVDPDIGPLDAPEVGTDGRFFWIRQKMPPEKTFPQGFEYVMAGIIVGPRTNMELAEDQQDLGTPPYLPADQQKLVDEKGFFWLLYPKYKAIRAAAGSAATAVLPNQPDMKFDCLIAVVTTNDSPDPLSEAKSRLLQAEKDGFDKLVAENEDWYKALYDRREKGRVFRGTAKHSEEQALDAFRSWTQAHHSVADPDPTRYESVANYIFLEQDWDAWHGSPCYNELFHTYIQVQNRADRMSYYYKLYNFWLPALKSNADEVFDLPGAALLHGYLPPIKPDKYAHCTSTWEFCMEIPAQVMRTLWDAWDYGGDERFLAESVYPALRETAIFYSHYTALGEDGYYHVIPTVSAEHWGWTKGFERNKDSTSALCMFRWLLNRAADASEVLGLDGDLRARWREVASKMAPYPTWDTPDGTVYTDVRGVNPIGTDYNWFAGVYPCMMADEVNLDSTPADKEFMLRTGRLVKSWVGKAQTELLLGVSKGYQPEQLINSRSGRIHFFPGVPADATVAFRDMQARGGFEVSAEYVSGKATYVFLRARRSVECRLMNPWPGKTISIVDSSGKEVPFRRDRKNGECLIFSAERGHSYEVRLVR